METVVYLIRHADKMVDVIDQYKSKDSFQQKIEKQVLSVIGEKQAKELALNSELNEVSVIYASHFVRTIATAKYLAYKNGLNINVDERLGERVVGELPEGYIRDSYNNIQFHDFNYKSSGGESVNDVKRRMKSIFKEVINKHEGETIALFSHEIAIISYLTDYCEIGYNLDDKLILSYNETSIPSQLQQPDIIKIKMEDLEIESIVRIELDL